MEWGETPVWIDPLALVGLLLVASTSWRRSCARKGPLYVTLWYFMAAFVWTFLTYAMGNFMPRILRRRHQRRRGRRTVHPRPGRPVRHAAGLGPDVLLRADPAQEADLEPRPVAGRLLGPGVLLSAQGIHHFLYTPIPMFLQYGAVVSTIAVELVVTTVIDQFLRHALGHRAGRLSTTCRSAGSTPAWCSTSSPAFSAPCR